MISEGVRQAEVARKLRVSAASVSRWHSAVRERGEAALKTAGRAGRKPRLSPAQWEAVEEKLLAGPVSCGYKTELWTLARIADVVESVAGVHYDTGHLSRLLKAMGWSCQKPKRKAKERNEEDIARWVKEEWPRIQKGP